MFEIIGGACGHDCPDTCRWLVEVRGGVAEKLYGDPQHPFTRGTLCAKVNHYLERVYHPDRVLHPMKRVGPKGAGRFERVSWEQALTDIAARWQAIIAESGAEAILPYSLAGTQGLIHFASLDRRLFGLLGCSRLDRNICGEVAASGLGATQGSSLGIDPEDLVHSRYIILWGTNTLVTNLHLWPVIRAARERGAKVVVIDPVRTRTAEAADWHIAPRPATDGALALGMMHVLIRDGLVDRDYVDRYALGYDELAERAREYPPERAAEITGLDAGVIEQLAREYGAAVPSVIRPLIGIEHHRNGAMMFRTIACLPVLTGAWRHRGGGLCRSTGALQFSTFDMNALFLPQYHQPDVRTLNMRDLGRDLCSTTLAPPIRALMVWSCNPAVTVPNQNAILRGLAREDLFTVVHDLFVTETARYADYVLPAVSQIESLDIIPAWGHHYLSMSRPAIAPCGEAVSNTELFRRLAAALGRTEPWLFESDETLLRAALASGHPYLEGITYERLWNEGYAHFTLPEDFRPFAHGGFPTASGKAELYSAALAARGLDALPTPGEIRRPTGRHALQLITGKSLHYLNASYAPMARHTKNAGPIAIELHAEDAARYGVFAGAAVRVFNDGGELTALCHVSDRVRPGVASMPFGAMRDLHGARRSANALTPEEPTDWAGGSGFYDAFVSVEPA